MALITYPLNNIEYTAEDAELFHITRTSGVYALNSFEYSVSGADNTVIIGTGIAWIKNSEFAGKVIAQKEAITLDLGLPDSVYPRIDSVVIQFDANNNETNIVVKQGLASSFPVAPSVVQTEVIYELHLYHIRREAGALYITPDNITDLRLNNSYCGLMADAITQIDTTAIERQISGLIELLQNEIQGVRDGSAYLLRDGSVSMSGNLLMGGQKINNLGEAVNDGDAVNLGQAKVLFAPAGFGYGGQAIILSDVANEEELNTALASVYNNMESAETKLVTFLGFPASGWRWFGIISKSSDNNGSFVAHSAYNGGTEILKTKNSGVWKPLEWENPPMAVGVEYRTTERWNGKPVYKKLIGYDPTSAWSGEMRIKVPHGISNLDMLLSATTTTLNYLLPLTTDITITNVTDWSDIELTIYNNGGWGKNRTWYIELRYTKDS